MIYIPSLYQFIHPYLPSHEHKFERFKVSIFTDKSGALINELKVVSYQIEVIY